MLGSFVAVVTLWANVNSSQSLGRSTKPNISKAAERIFCWGLCPHTHRFLGVRFFGKMKPQVQKKRCQKPPERITIEIITITSCFPRGAVTPSQSFPCVWAPCAAPCLGATSWVLQQDLRKVDLTPCMALTLQFRIYCVMFSSFCFKSSPKWQEKRLSLESFAKGFEDVQVCPCHQICCHYCSGHHPAGPTAPTRVPAGHTGSAPATAAHGDGPIHTKHCCPLPHNLHFLILRPIKSLQCGHFSRVLLTSSPKGLSSHGAGAGSRCAEARSCHSWNCLKLCPVLMSCRKEKCFLLSGEKRWVLEKGDVFSHAWTFVDLTVTAPHLRSAHLGLD